MVADFDVIDFLHTLTDRSVRLLSASEAGVVLADPRGELRVAAASSEAAGLVELFQIQNDQGPCLECYRTGQPVTAADLAGPGQQWPQFAAAATQAGFRAVQALPMRLRDQVIGALNLFRAAPGLLDPEDVRIGQALADVATIGLLHERNLRRSETVAEQLQGALNRRTIIEQAKGKLAERLGTDMDEAFRVLRAHARDRNQRLTDTARYLIDNPAAEFPAPSRRPGPAQYFRGSGGIRSGSGAVGRGRPDDCRPAEPGAGRPDIGRRAARDRGPVTAAVR
jgi:GAF domain/ANTAR domain